MRSPSVKSSFVWQGPGGLREVLILAFPLILSTASWTVQQFIDRMFLAWYSAETIAAAMPAGMLNFACVSLFMGMASYVDTFVAQYYGAGRLERIGPAIWQGVYVGLLGGLALALLVPLAGPIFALVGHAEAVQRHEVVYFSILNLGAAPPIVAAALSGFYAGRGKPWPVLWVNLGGTLVNIVLDWLLIFGRWGLPALGMAGAAIATVISGVFNVAVYAWLIFRPRYDSSCQTLKGWRLERELFSRLVRYGLPAGVQFFFDMAAFTLFVLFVGRLGINELAATNIAFNISNFSFMPMVGQGIAVSVLVGQYLGRNQPELAARSCWSAFWLAAGYMGLVALVFVLVPQVFIAPFISEALSGRFAPIQKQAEMLLRFVALYSIFDAMNIMFASALKGAGDTRFVMLTILIMGLFTMVLPVYVAVQLKASLYVCWSFVTLNIAGQGLAFLWRFKRGAWRQLRVIEMPVD
ncbi:MAG: Multidrug resistance protein NorM [Deltaproteobacteria bacterium ADurb.Bin510]|nr:MAG: Multidrug resistance protein NorM [Deltaproteobacteria bacterium ADurb.Bin510]